MRYEKKEDIKIYAAKFSSFWKVAVERITLCLIIESSWHPRTILGDDFTTRVALYTGPLYNLGRFNELYFTCYNM